ncbi:MAG: hypothetical protein ACREJ9_05010 [Candidatus Rokuibacteriota bacterium]
MSAAGTRTRLLAVWLVLLGFMVAIVALELTDLVGPTPGPDSHGQVVPDARMLLPVPVDQLGAIEIGHARTIHRFERNAAGLWSYHSAHSESEGPHVHQAEPSMAARIESAFAAFGRTRIERRLALDRNAAEYGVGMPGMFILVYRPNDRQPLAQYAIGDIAPNALSRYVLRVGTSAVVTIPNYQIDNLLALIEGVTSSP